MIRTASVGDLRRLERRLAEPLDLEREAWEGRRYRFFARDGSVLRLPVPHTAGRGPGSFLTYTNLETIYSNPLVGTSKNTFTSEAQINDTAGMGPEPVLPREFFLPSLSRSKSVRIVARGIRSDVVTTPTWQLFCRFNTSSGVITGSNVGSIPATQISATAATNLIWEFEEDIQLTVEGAAGANSTLRGLGLATFQATAAGVNTVLAILAGGASPGTVATFDMTVDTFITISAACGTSSGSNAIQVLQLFVFGLN